MVLGWMKRENHAPWGRDACVEAGNGNEGIHYERNSAASIAMSPRHDGLDFVHCCVKAGGAIWARGGAVDDGACNTVDGRADGACDVRQDGDRTDASLHCCETLLMEGGESSAIAVRGGSPWFYSLVQMM